MWCSRAKSCCCFFSHCVLRHLIRRKCHFLCSSNEVLSNVTHLSCLRFWSASLIRLTHLQGISKWPSRPVSVKHRRGKWKRTMSSFTWPADPLTCWPPDLLTVGNKHTGFICELVMGWWCMCVCVYVYLPGSPDTHNSPSTPVNMSHHTGGSLHRAQSSTPPSSPSSPLLSRPH